MNVTMTTTRIATGTRECKRMRENRGIWPSGLWGGNVISSRSIFGGVRTPVLHQLTDLKRLKTKK